MTNAIYRRKTGFTIVELLIVIVVIAVLAAITVAAYNGIQQRARASEVSSALSQSVKKIKLWQVDNPNTTPATLSTVGIANTGNVTYQYKPGTGGSYCITATSGATSYKITESSSPVSGGCSGHGQGGIAAITNLANNPSFEADFGWLSNNGVPYPVAIENSIVRTGSRSRVGWNTNGSTVLMTLYGAGATDGSGMPITEGGTYTFTCYFRAEVPHYSYIRSAYRLSGAYSTAESSPTVTGQAGQWTRVSHTMTIPDGADRLRMIIDVASSTTQPAGTRAYVDDAMLTKGNTSPAYADGNSTNWDWTGAQNISTSTGPAL